MYNNGGQRVPLRSLRADRGQTARRTLWDSRRRGGVFVGLHRAVRQGIRASVESYSIKRLEPLYAFDREVDLRDAGTSIVEFETWLELGQEEEREDLLWPFSMARRASWFWEMSNRSSNSHTAAGLSHTRGGTEPVFIAARLLAGLGGPVPPRTGWTPAGTAPARMWSYSDLP